MKCIICGKEIEKSNFSHKIICSNKCFDEDYWNTILDENAIIINGNCYHDGGLNFNKYDIRGYGGTQFYILFNDGKVLFTNNLWHNGRVPIERKIQDNAKFITKEEYDARKEEVI